MKKLIAAALITILAASTLMLSIGTHMAQATSYYAKVGDPGPDEFCFCVHYGTYNDPDDTWVTLGMYAYYDTYNPYSYSWVYWSWDAGVGGNGLWYYWFYGAPTCVYAFDQYGYWSGGVFSTPGEPQYIGDRWYWDFEGGGSISPSAHVISGQSYAFFYEILQPYNVHYVEATPNPVTELTAQAGPPYVHEWSLP